MRERLYDIAHQVLRLSDADGTEVIVQYTDDLLSRYANSFITQNSREKFLRITVRLRYGNRAGVASTDKIDRESLAHMVRSAKEIALNSPQDPDLPEVPGPNSLPDYPPSFDESIQDPDPGRAARIIGEIIERGKPLRAFGNLSQGHVHYLFLTSEGFEGYHRSSRVSVSINYMDDTFTQSGWAQGVSYRFSDIEESFMELADKSYRKAHLNRDPVELKPGRYTVIVENIGLDEILMMMGWLGLSGKAYYEGTSFLRGKLGEKVFSDKLTIVDDPSDPYLFTMPFDFEGVAKKPVYLIERGVFRSPALDRRYARKLGLESTGHAIYPFHSMPFPLHMKVMEGDRTLEEMIEETDYGLLITRFWYVNTVDPSSFTLTGLTRDGTFLIEGGRITKAVRNLRFTQSFLEAFNNIEALESRSIPVSEFNYYHFFPTAIRTPSMKIRDFTFTSVSEF